MISLLRGTVHERHSDRVTILTVGGVGYDVSCSQSTLSKLPATGSEVDLLCHLVVREDAQLLYGFGSPAERELFLLLVSVPSVGPKVALALLSSAEPDELAVAIAGSDVARLQQAPGIGKKMAERIASELREKVGGPMVFAQATAGGVGNPHLEAREGLLGLGLSVQEIDAALANATGSTASELIAEALRSTRA